MNRRGPIGAWPPRLPAGALLGALALVLGATPGIASAKGPPPSRPNQPVCPGPAHGAAGCHSRVVTDAAGMPLATSGPTGYGPAAFHGAYELPSFASTPQTIAIVDAYDSPTIESDLAVYSSTYGLPPCTTANGCFQKVNQDGDEGPYPKPDAGWALEIALDVEVAHAICQNCKVLLVEGDSNLFSDLTAAVETAASMGATEISNSYGGPEYAGEASDTSYDVPGVAVTVSAGDSGYGAEYPAASPYVVAVGGTTLTLGASNSYGAETVWSGSGSGCSAYLVARSWQTSDTHWAATGCGAKRGVADIAADANPSTGASVYDTTKYQGQSGWFVLGGTSLSAPLIAAVYALAGGGDAEYPAAIPYAHQGDSPAALHDVSSGSNGSCGGATMCKAAVGYDGPTGVGTPRGVAAFGVALADTTPPTSSASSPATAESAAISISYTASDGGSGLASVELWAKAPGEGSHSKVATDFSPTASGSFAYTASAGDGIYSFYTRAKDLAGNYEAAPGDADSTTLLDTTPPEEPPSEEEPAPEEPPSEEPGPEEPAPIAEPPAATAPLPVLTEPLVAPTPEPVAPIAGFSLTRAKGDGAGGGSIVMASVPGPGSLVLYGRKVRTVTRRVTAAGVLVLHVRLKTRFRRLGQAKVSVAFTPLGGAPSVKTATVSF